MKNKLNDYLYWQNTKGKQYCGDVLEVLKKMPDESVNCVMTSPPYWNQRDYGVKGQIGLEDTPEEYVDRLCAVFDEVRRVLRKDGVCWVNIGDTYSNNKNRGGGDPTIGKRNLGGKNYPKRKLIKIPNKSLCLIPSRFAIEMVSRGWIFRNEIIWHKNNVMPSSATDRFTINFEKVYMLTKSKKYYFEQQLEPSVSKDNTCRDRDSTRLNNVPGRSRMGGLKTNHYDFRNMRTVWHINNTPYKGAHFAVFPEKLVETPIKAGCPKGGVVLDPFSGSGVVRIVAERLERKWLGIDLSRAYCKLAKERKSKRGL